MFLCPEHECESADGSVAGEREEHVAADQAGPPITVSIDPWCTASDTSSAACTPALMLNGRLPVRRTALFIEESLYWALKWVVFEPNDEPLWAQIRLNVGAFMQNLFRQGAFQGKTPNDAYFVKCDKETTTQNDINLGIVNIVVGFAPLKPAEFVVIQLQQMAGQIQT